MDVRPPRGGAKGEGQSAEFMDDRMKELAREKEEMEKKKESTDADVDHDGDGGSALVSTKRGSTDGRLGIAVARDGDAGEPGQSDSDGYIHSGSASNHGVGSSSFASIAAKCFHPMLAFELRESPL